MPPKLSANGIASQLEEEPDAAWVAALAGVTVARAQGALREGLAQDDLVKEVLGAHKAGGRDSYAHIRAPFELWALVRLLSPDHVIEAGVSSGVSSAFFLSALRANGRGRLHSLDLPTPQLGRTFSPDKDSPVALPPGRASGWAVPLELRQGWDLRIGTSQDLLGPLVAELPSIGVFLHDDEHTFENATREFTTIAPKLRPGSVVLADNTNWLDGALEVWAAGRGLPVRTRKGDNLQGVRIP